MNKENSSKATSLRHSAEEELIKKLAKTSPPLSETDILKLNHELQVHQIELEMQNQELQLTDEELKLAKEDAYTATQKYAELYDFAPMDYFTLSKEGEIIDLNFRGAKMLGKERSDLLGGRFGLFVSEDTKPIFNIFLDKIFTNETEETCELKLSVEDKSERYVQLSGIVSKDGKQCFTTIRDINLLKKTEDTLEFERQRLASILEGTNAGTWEWNVQTGETVFSERWAEFIGYTLEELSPVNIDTWTKYCHPEDLILSNDVIKKHLKGELDFYECESRMKHKNGDWIWVIDRGKINKWDENGKPLLMSGTHQNITERKSAEKALIESEYRFKALFEKNASIMLMIYAESGNIFNANNSASAFYGYSIADLCSMSICDLNTLPKELVDAERKLAFEGKRKCFYFKHRKANGEIRDVEVYSSPIKIDGKDILYSIINDVTERNQVELVIQQKNEELKKLNSDKDLFISILGHDLRSPFNGLLGLSNLLNENIQDFDIEQIEKMAGLINKTANNAFNLLEDILLWARTQQGKIPFRLQILKFQDIYMNIFEVLNLTANEKNITLNYTATDQLKVFADADMLKTVLRNLISNAIKFTNNGGTINISAVKTPSITTISVSDNGVGISPDSIAKLFDIAQVITRTGTANEKGTGLGLLLCKEFVEKHGGRIWVESEVGVGSNFKFTLPISSEIENPNYGLS